MTSNDELRAKAEAARKVKQFYVAASWRLAATPERVIALLDEIRELSRDCEEAESETGSYARGWHDTLRQLQKLEAENERLRTALQSVEWVDQYAESSSVTVSECPECCGRQPIHERECNIAAALADAAPGAAE